MGLQFEHRSALKAVLLVLGESLIIFGSALLIKVWQDSAGLSFAFTSNPYLNAFIFTLLCQASIYFCGLYDPGLQFGWIEQLIGLVQAFAIAFTIMLLVLVFIGRIIDPVNFLLGFLTLLAFSKAWRLLIFKLSATGFFRPNIILLGTDGPVREIYNASLTESQTANAKPRACNFKIVAVADAKTFSGGPAIHQETPYSALQSCKELPELVCNYKTSKVIICKQLADSLSAHEVCSLKHKGIQLCTADAILEAITGRREPAELDPKELILSDSFQHSIRRCFKRCGDIVIASILLVFLSPLILAVGINLKLRKAGRVFETQPCVGFRKNLFTRYLFSFPTKTSSNQFPGRRIQALPQLWNILKGDMSLVGPCPIGPQQAEKISHELPIFDERFTVRPGLTGWAQVNCDCDGSNKTIKHMFGYDLFYLKHLSLFLDIVVLARTTRLHEPCGQLVGSNM
ncbi:MAG: hypothetical protein C4519_09655 [Desulfobacteraceae bacterium]|nr:MAG: hypothetical protein C4519_09655 [Desulfobacteraceae bacterium]